MRLVSDFMKHTDILEIFQAGLWPSGPESIADLVDPESSGTDHLPYQVVLIKGHIGFLDPGMQQVVMVLPGFKPVSPRLFHVFPGLIIYDEKSGKTGTPGF